MTGVLIDNEDDRCIDSAKNMSQIPTPSTVVDAVTSTLAAATLATYACLIPQSIPRIDLYLNHLQNRNQP